jgi:hypothetical protein
MLLPETADSDIGRRGSRLVRFPKKIHEIERLREDKKAGGNDRETRRLCKRE